MFQKIRPHLEFNHFTVKTDHQALTQLLRHTRTNPRLTRWTKLLGFLDMEIQYSKGSLHKNADYLGRFPVSPPEPDGVADMPLFMHEMHTAPTITGDASLLRGEQNKDDIIVKVWKPQKPPYSLNIVDTILCIKVFYTKEGVKGAVTSDALWCCSRFVTTQ